MSIKKGIKCWSVNKWKKPVTKGRMSPFIEIPRIGQCIDTGWQFPRVRSREAWEMTAKSMRCLWWWKYLVLIVIVGYHSVYAKSFCIMSFSWAHYLLCGLYLSSTVVKSRTILKEKWVKSILKEIQDLIHLICINKI